MIPTAEMAATCRALGNRDSDPLLRNPDHLASRLIPWSRRPSSGAKLPLARGAIKKMFDKKVPGALLYETMRTRHMDAVLLGEVRAGAQQVVVLGAGYDSRAYRFADELADVRTFEVDHPRMSQLKQDRVKSVIGRLPSNVVYVDVDFENQDLGTRLADAGYRPGVRGVAIWAGVVPYLTQPAIDRTLRWFADSSATGSVIVFDHVFEEFIDGTMTSPAIDEIRRATQAAGEPMVTGIPVGRTSEYLAQRGLELLVEMLPKEAAEHYAARPDGSPPQSPLEDIGPFVSARVPSRDLRGGDHGAGTAPGQLQA